MKIRLWLLTLSAFACLGAWSQQDPMEKNKRSKEDKAKDEKLLNQKGKGEYEKAKAEMKNIKDAKFELAANEIVNGDLKSLVGISGKPDEALANEQNKENKKNEKELKTNLKKDSKMDTDKFEFDASGAPPAGAAWTDGTFWYPAYYTTVKNQGGCGSCWAFAAAATFEHATRKLFGVTLDLSEQDIVACGTTCTGVDCGSCGGGWSDRAFDYIKCKGVALEAAYNYTGTSTPCYTRPKSKFAYTWGRLLTSGTWPTREWIKYYITMYGSVVTYMKAGLSTFFSYGGGVYNGYPSSNPYDIDHAVTIVGWYEPYQAWIIKNSWGPGWGPYGGYAYVSYNACNIGKWIYWVYPRP
jgi:C1A family cysteine protease